MAVAKWKDNLGVKRLEFLPLYSTQIVRAAPRDEQAAAEEKLRLLVIKKQTQMETQMRFQARSIGIFGSRG